MTIEEAIANGNEVQLAEPEKQSTDQTTDNENKKTLALSVHQNTLLPNNRPIEPSHLEVFRTYSSVGSVRPITKSTMKISNTMAISGNRPIAVSTLKVSETYVVMGNRPVASNEMEDTATLMGFID
ncbi:hypothetical protein IQ238_16275 [Pleurocapsales cyanobacterium LEGE 06147]|nr:hypothetical protein [Pleurocapsales cyanobacterium LEGE 06147]